MTKEMSHAVRHNMIGMNNSNLNELELTSVYALLAYTAHEQKVSEETVRDIVTTHFGVNAIPQLQCNLYDEVIKFMIDLQVDMLLN